MRLTTCVQQFFDLYHFRIKGSSQQTIKAYREALALFLPFAAKYYSIKISSLSIDHLSLQLILSFLDYLQSDRSNAANTRNQRLAVIKSLAKMIRLMYPQKREIADIILAIPQKKSSKKSLPSIRPLILKNPWALGTIPSYIYSLIPAPELVKLPCSMLITSTRVKKP
jgi:site-specific recombinase XerD